MNMLMVGVVMFPTTPSVPVIEAHPGHKVTYHCLPSLCTQAVHRWQRQRRMPHWLGNLGTQHTQCAKLTGQRPCVGSAHRARYMLRFPFVQHISQRTPEASTTHQLGFHSPPPRRAARKRASSRRMAPTSGKSLRLQA